MAVAWATTLFAKKSNNARKAQRRPWPWLKVFLELLEDRTLLSATAALQQAYGQLPLSFEVNDGQTASQVQYLSHGSGYALFLTQDSAVLSLTQPSASPADSTSPPASTIGVALAMNLVGANPQATVTGLDQQAGVSNYFIGNDPSQWHTNVANYGEVAYQNVYAGVDLVYYGNQSQLEYDFVVAPGANPSSIQLNFQGQNGMSLDAQGDLVLQTATGDVLQKAPVIYQEVDGVRQTVTGQFVLGALGQVSFQVGAYDTSLPLTIDPVLSYSTYLGGNGNDYAQGIAVDGSGNAYVTGYTSSINYPSSAGAFQTNNASDGPYNAFVTKLNGAGTALIYSTYLGGNSGDYGFGIAVDTSGNAYVTGQTYSSNFPTTAGAFQTSHSSNGGGRNAFVSKLNAAGTALIYSTYLGGNGSDVGEDIAVDSLGNAYVAIITTSSNLPATPGAFQTSFGGSQDSFITKLNTAGTALIYSTYLGGDPGALNTNTFSNVIGIAVDGSGNAYITGTTNSPSFPTTVGAYQTVLGGGNDAYVTKLNAAGAALIYSTYLGGNSGDGPEGIAVDASGDAYVTGFTDSTNFPATPNAFQTSFGGGPGATSNVFVTKLNAAGTALIYSTYLGGNSDDEGRGIAVDGSGNAYVTGYTSSSNFPTTADAFQTGSGGGYDAFVTELNATGTALIYSTYLGGNSSDNALGMAVDTSGNAYITGITDSTNFPTTTSAFQTSFGGGSDAFVAKFNFATPTTTTLTDNGPNPSLVCQTVTFTATVGASAGTPTGSVTFEDGNNTLGVASISAPQPTGWEYVASLPTPTDILAATTGLDGTIYAVGGEVNGAGTDGGGRTNALQGYDTTTNSWTTLANMLIASDHLAAATGPDGQIYAIGGVTLSGSGVVQAYDPATNTWATVASLLTPCWGLAAAMGPNGLIYAIGGSNSNNNGVPTNAVEAYNTANNTWTTEASMPTARTYLAAVTGPDGRIYAFGGTSVTGGALDTVEAYDVYTNTWSTVASMPIARNVLAAAVGPDGSIYVIGGDGGDNVVEAYNVYTNTWTTAASLLTPSGGLAAAPGPDGRIYAIGGNGNGGFLTTVEALSFTNPTATFSTTSLSAGSHSILAVYSGDTNFVSSTSNTVNQTVQPTFQVTSVTATPTGVVLSFNAPIDPTTTVLYSSPGDTIYGPADLTLTGSAGNVIRGSLVIDPTNPFMATFVQTSGLLPSDTYILKVTTALKAVGGASLSQTYLALVSVTAPTTPVLSVPSFARGPGQAVTLSGSLGIPVSISSATDVTQASFTLTYDPTLLAIATSGALSLSSAAVAAGLTIQSYTITTTDAHHDVLNVTLSGGTGLTTSSAVPLVTITASVPVMAPYRDKSLLNVGSVMVNNVPTAGVSGVDVVAYLGDVLGTGVPNATDASLVDQVGSGAGTGFSVFKDLDPAIIAAIDGSGSVNANDASLINEAGSGANVSQIPSVPTLPIGVSLTFGGPDPYLYLSAVQGAPGQTVTETLYLDVTDPNGIQLTALDEAIGFDASQLQVSNGRSAAGLTGIGSYATASTADNITGVLLVGQAFEGTGLPPVVAYGTKVAVLQFDVMLNANAAVGDVSGLTLLQDGSINGQLKYTAISDNEGALPFTPGMVPSNSGNAAVDGNVTVLPAVTLSVATTSDKVTTTKAQVTSPNEVQPVRRVVLVPETTQSTPVIAVAGTLAASDTNLSLVTTSVVGKPATAGEGTVTSNGSVLFLVPALQPTITILSVSSPDPTLVMSGSPNLGAALSLVAMANTRMAPAATTETPATKAPANALDEIYRQLSNVVGAPSVYGTATSNGTTAEELLDLWKLDTILAELDTEK